jgi:hypothetical protein
MKTTCVTRTLVARDKLPATARVAAARPVSPAIVSVRSGVPPIVYYVPLTPADEHAELDQLLRRLERRVARGL